MKRENPSEAVLEFRELLDKQKHRISFIYDMDSPYGSKPV